MRKNDDSYAGCGCYLLVFLVLNIGLGGLSFNYCLWFVFGKDVPWYADAICGLILAEITIPVMMVCWILNLCGISAPLVG